MGGGDGKKNMDGRMRHGGRWREETSWPLTRTRFTKYYLGGNGGLYRGQTVGEAVLEQLPLRSQESGPVHRRNLLVLRAHPAAGCGKPHDHRQAHAGAAPRCSGSEGETRRLHLQEQPASRGTFRDILIFQTPPLQQDIEVVGPLMMKLWASSSAIDTDFTAKLIDVHPANDDYPKVTR